jgi:hypothetical protein
MLQQVQYWISKDKQPDILIFSSGAHIRSEHLFRNNWKLISKQIVELHGLFPTMKLIWKTQNPGHVECGKYDSPTTSYSKGNETLDIYNWNLYEDFDRISRQHVETLAKHIKELHQTTSNSSSTTTAAAADKTDNHNEDVIRLLDVSPLYLRPDAHPHFINDCLHFCMPGPLDLIAVLLLNMLMHENL